MKYAYKNVIFLLCVVRTLILSTNGLMTESKLAVMIVIKIGKRSMGVGK